MKESLHLSVRLRYHWRFQFRWQWQVIGVDSYSTSLDSRQLGFEGARAIISLPSRLVVFTALGSLCQVANWCKYLQLTLNSIFSGRAHFPSQVTVYPCLIWFRTKIILENTETHHLSHLSNSTVSWIKKKLSVVLVQPFNFFCLGKIPPSTVLEHTLYISAFVRG